MARWLTPALQAARDAAAPACQRDVPPSPDQLAGVMAQRDAANADLDAALGDLGATAGRAAS